MKKLILFLFVLTMSVSLKAQDRLTPEQENMAKLRVQQKVGVFTGYLEAIANKGESLEYRLYYKNAALGLFIAKGWQYNEISVDGYGNTIKRRVEGVKMDVTSINRVSKKPYLMRDYLYHLANLKYSQVKLLTTEVSNMKVSKLEKIADGTYMCVCFFKQAFIGYRDGIPVYKDITEKRVECIITTFETIDGIEFAILLGDVTALETTKINSNINNDKLSDIVNQ